MAVNSGWISHLNALEQTLVTLRFFLNSPQGPDVDGTGYQGFYYHFLDMHTDQKVWQCELSTIDTTILLSGMLVAVQFFNQYRAGDTEVGQFVEQLTQRAH